MLLSKKTYTGCVIQYDGLMRTEMHAYCRRERLLRPAWHMNHWWQEREREQQRTTGRDQAALIHRTHVSPSNHSSRPVLNTNHSPSKLVWSTLPSYTPIQFIQYARPIKRCGFYFDINFDKCGQISMISSRCILRQRNRINITTEHYKMYSTIQRSQSMVEVT